MCIFNPMASCWDKKTRGEGKRERRAGERQTETERNRGRHWETKSTSRRAFSLHPVLEWKNLCRVKGLGSDLALLCFIKPTDLKQIRFMLREPKFFYPKTFSRTNFSNSFKGRPFDSLGISALSCSSLWIYLQESEPRDLPIAALCSGISLVFNK